MSKENLHKAILELKELRESMGRMPTRREFVHEFGWHWEKFAPSWLQFVQMAGMDAKEIAIRGSIKQPKIITEKPHSFNVVAPDFQDMFRKSKKKVLKFLIIPDIHFDHQDDLALECFFNFALDYNADGFINLGDVADMSPISHWGSETLEPESLVPQMKNVQNFFQRLIKENKNMFHRFYLKSNHDDWLRQYLIQNAKPLAFKLEDLGVHLTVEQFYNLKEFKIEAIEYNALLKLGNAYFTHGLYTGANYVKTHIDVLKKNIFFGHEHTAFRGSQTSVDGLIEGASFGCLCKLDAPFLKGKPNNWVQGFGTFEFISTGEFSWAFHRIHNGKLFFNGKVFG